MALTCKATFAFQLRNVLNVSKCRHMSTSPLTSSVTEPTIKEDEAIKTEDTQESNVLRKSEDSKQLSITIHHREQDVDERIAANKKRITNLLNMRFAYPEFLPDPDMRYRNLMREKMERSDMLARRSQVEIPEFYVGSIVAVIHSDQHAPGKSNRFLGICICRGGCGLRANFILRNVIDGEGVEVHFDMYDPTIQRIDVIRLEKRLDDELFYLRDAPLEYSTFPMNMETEFVLEGAPVPVNTMKIPLNPTPWLVRWERMNMQGISDVMSYVNVKRQRMARLKQHTRPWEKYDLMKMYRETIPAEDQTKIFGEVQKKLNELELIRHKMKRSRNFVRPKKIG